MSDLHADRALFGLTVAVLGAQTALTLYSAPPETDCDPAVQFASVSLHEQTFTVGAATCAKAPPTAEGANVRYVNLSALLNILVLLLTVFAFRHVTRQKLDKYLGIMAGVIALEVCARIAIAVSKPSKTRAHFSAKGRGLHTLAALYVTAVVMGAAHAYGSRRTEACNPTLAIAYLAAALGVGVALFWPAFASAADPLRDALADKMQEGAGG